MKAFKKLLSQGRKAVKYQVQWFSSPARLRNQTTLPTMLNFPITDNCNSRCVMCDVWKTKSVNELTSTEWRKILQDKLFRQIQHVGISGGEPTLRTDLVEIVQTILDALPKLKSLTITSHGFHVKRWEEFLPQIVTLCNKKRIQFRLNLSVDGIGEVHDKVRGIPGGYEKTIRTLNLAKGMGVDVELQSTISSSNVYNTGQILALAKQMDSRIVFRQATNIIRLDNASSVSKVELNENEKSYFADFLLSEQVQSYLPNLQRGLFYKNFTRQVTTDGKRRAPCYFQNEGILLTAHGDMYHCSISTEKMGNVFEDSPYRIYFSEKSRAIRERLLQHQCKVCIHDQTGAWSPYQLFSHAITQHKLFKKAKLGYEALVIALVNLWLLVKIGKTNLLKQLAQTDAKKPNMVGQKQNASALLIGAYGGEHVGDAAILGGVLFRLHQKYAIRLAYVASTRPDRTQRWVNELDVPVEVKVIDYNYPAAKTTLLQTDYLVYAGGPIMDLPVLLSKHLQIATTAYEHDIPFIIEGVGIGPFRLFLSKWTAQILLRLATTITVRTSASSKSTMVQGSDPNLGRDPAFDYLETRKDVNKISARELASIDQLLEHTSDKLKIGVNLRPLWVKYSALTKGELQQVEKNFLHNFATALTEFSELHQNQVTYLFFPMNPDQYGFSDLLISYQLKSKLPNHVDFRIWEIEPGIDAVLQLLRRLDLAITMRFHASIFALSQHIPTLGIDYMHGSKGKVGELFSDMSLSDYATRIDQFSCEWLVKQLNIISHQPLETQTLGQDDVFTVAPVMEVSLR